MSSGSSNGSSRTVSRGLMQRKLTSTAISIVVPVREPVESAPSVRIAAQPSQSGVALRWNR